MSQRNSDYTRRERDLYCTPAWVTKALLPHIPPRVLAVWEPAAGYGDMARVLMDARYAVSATDIEANVPHIARHDFLASGEAPLHDAIITNPPYVSAATFVEQALKLTESKRGFVAMLLRVDFDSAKTRRHLFGDCPAWSKKIILTRRIKWFDGPSSPSENHAWFCWDHQNCSPASIAYYYEQTTR